MKFSELSIGDTFYHNVNSKLRIKFQKIALTDVKMSYSHFIIRKNAITVGQSPYQSDSGIHYTIFLEDHWEYDKVGSFELSEEKVNFLMGQCKEYPRDNLYPVRQG